MFTIFDVNLELGLLNFYSWRTFNQIYEREEDSGLTYYFKTVHSSNNKNIQ